MDLDILSRPAVRQQLNVSNVAAPVVLLTLLPMLVAVLAVAVLLPLRHLFWPCSCGRCASLGASGC